MIQKREKDLSISPKWGDFGLQQIDINYRSKRFIIYSHQILTIRELEDKISKILLKLKAQCHKEEVLSQARQRQYELSLI